MRHFFVACAVRHFVLALAVGAAAPLAGRAQPPTVAPPDPDRVRALAGCYRLTLGPWSQQSPLGPAAPTTLVRLDTLPRRPELPDQLAADRLAPVESLPPNESRARWRQLPGWRVVGADSVVIVAWSSRFEAEVFYGRRVGDTLRGVLRRTSDGVPVDPVTRQVLWNAWPWATASAERVRCD